MKFDGEITKMSAGWFIGEVERAAPRSVVRMFLNTPGGEIYPGGDMIIAVRKAMAERGVKFEIELGSCVASMGASLVAAVKASGGRVIAHRNTAVMFHGCYGIVLGGADELRDNADSMEVFNNSVKADLAAIGIRDTDDWFAADRQKWLGAPEMLEIGLIDEIYEDEAETPTDYRVVADRLAAKLNHQEVSVEDENKKPCGAEENPEVTPEEPQKPKKLEPCEPETAPEEVPVPGEVPEEECPKKPCGEETEEEEGKKKPCAEDMVPASGFNAMRSEYDRRISDLQKTINGLNEELSARQQAETTLRDELAKATADLDAARKDAVDKSALEAEIASLKAKHEEAIAPALAHVETKLSVKDIAASRMTPEEKVKALLNH